jgi:hypothetical protein
VAGDFGANVPLVESVSDAPDALRGTAPDARIATAPLPPGAALMTPHVYRDRARKAIIMKADETAMVNGSSHTRSLEDLRYYAGVVDGLRAAVTILDDTLNTLDEEDD